MNSVYYYFWPDQEEPSAVPNAVPETVPTPVIPDIVPDPVLPKKFIICADDLKKVNLNHQKDVIPGPSRNMPVLDTFELQIYNKAHLDEILNIKLRPTVVNKKPTYYPPRHPVVKELNEKFGIGKGITV
jgi:hypothetical protein